MTNKKDIISLSVYLLAAVFLVYFVPVLLQRLFFLLFLVAFYKSKKNYIWLVFLFILIERPGGLFSGGLKTDMERLPIYTLGPGISFAFTKLFILTALIKAVKIKSKFRPVPFLRSNLNRLGVYFIFLFVGSIALNPAYGTIRNFYISVIDLTLYYSVFFLLNEEIEWVNFFKLLFPFSLIAFGLQLYSLVFGHQLIVLFKVGILSVQGVLGDNYVIQRPIEMGNILLINFFGTLYFFITSKKVFQKNYLLTVNIVSYFAIIITGTRSWVLAFTFGYLLILLLISRQATKLLLKYTLFIVLLTILLFSNSVFQKQYTSVMERISTLSKLANGDITAGGTIIRYDIRAPRLMEAFMQSSILFGAGFSPFYYQYADAHVGYHNFLFNAGIVGALLLAVFLFQLLRCPFVLNAQLFTDNPYKNSLKVFPITILMIMVLNTGTQFIGYDVGISRSLTLAVILLFINNQMSNAAAMQEQLSLKIQQPEAATREKTIP